MEAVDLLERSYPGKRAESKRQILRCALALFNEHGVEATTIELIRAESQTSVGSIYHHFGNKEGVIAALYMAALEDQARLRDSYLSTAETIRDGVFSLVYSYLDWVIEQPDWARFLYHARFSISRSGYGDQLNEANHARNSKLKEWIAKQADHKELSLLPPELLPSLLIGPTESYCRAWLSGRVKQSPDTHRQLLAEAAWKTVAKEA